MRVEELADNNVLGGKGMATIDCMGREDYLILTESDRKRRISDDIIREREKLEELILDVSENDRYNMGQDKRILMQSYIVDQLIVDEMMLSDIRDKYYETVNHNK